MPQTHHTLDPETLSKDEQRALLDQVDNLASLVGKDGEQTVLRVKDQKVVLPPSVARALVDVLAEMAEGRTVSVASSDEELTTREAAELLIETHNIADVAAMLTQVPDRTARPQDP